MNKVADRDEDFLVCRGRLRVIRFANVDGVPSPAKEGLSELPEKIQNAFKKRFLRLCEDGRLPKPRQIQQLDDVIWELKHDSGWRISAFQQGKVWLLANVFRKPGKRRLKQEIKRAREIRLAHLSKTEGKQ
ncbi:MAG: type II toxin-antitoxin system RelE/ParE family toxin [Planctomycetes bacterium]|nr:type II toxin-antitoxin system RelE/ParE family toxin [Planctomycetota bacterium]